MVKQMWHLIASAIHKVGRCDWDSDNDSLGCSHHEIEEFKVIRGMGNIRKQSDRLQASGRQDSAYSDNWYQETLKL